MALVSLAFLSLQAAIMTLYVKGFKIDSDKIANLVGAKDRVDPRVETGVFFTMDQLNRSAYFEHRIGP